jgi:hypothetical protein
MHAVALTNGLPTCMPCTYCICALLICTLQPPRSLWSSPLGATVTKMTAVAQGYTGYFVCNVDQLTQLALPTESLIPTPDLDTRPAQEVSKQSTINCIPYAFTYENLARLCSAACCSALAVLVLHKTLCMSAKGVLCCILTLLTLLVYNFAYTTQVTLNDLLPCANPQVLGQGAFGSVVRREVSPVLAARL